MQTGDNQYADAVCRPRYARISEVFVLRRMLTLHTSRAKNCPRVECRRVATNIGVIYTTVYGTMSRRDNHMSSTMEKGSYTLGVFVLYTQSYTPKRI